MQYPAPLALAVALTVGPLAAQSSAYVGPANLVFAMDSTVELACSNTTNQAHIVSDDGVLTFSPGGPVRSFALPLCDYTSWAAFFGDADADGDYADSIITSIDAIWVPPTASSPPGMFDVFVSIQAETGAAGYLGASVSDGDVFRLTPNGVETFLATAQVALAGFAPTLSNLDICGFAVDAATGDVYLTFSTAVTVNGTPLEDGGVARIPGSAITLVGGLVASVTPGAAEIVLDEAEVNAMFQHAGYDGVTDLAGIEIDPNGGTFVSSSTQQTVAHLWLCDDDFSDEGLVSTIGGGVVPSVNGVSLQGSAAFGLRGGFAGAALGNPFAIAFQHVDPTGASPLHLDTFPIAQATPTVFDLDLSGATPSGFVVYVLGLVDAATPGGFAPRGPAPIPLASPSWLEFYPGIPVPAAVLTLADAEGFARLSLRIGAPVPAGIGVLGQAGDLGTLVLSSPVVAVTL
ncbi:MAG: hypothetical protein KDE27_00400 [Planctomycetes bacterium]|nr:hypothetical protein [Planctomycetota bacterium]